MYKEIFEKNIKEARKKRKLSQQVVADMLQTTQSTIAKYENGTLEPNIETLAQMAVLYNISIDWLFGLKK